MIKSLQTHTKAISSMPNSCQNHANKIPNTYHVLQKPCQHRAKIKQQTSQQLYDQHDDNDDNDDNDDDNDDDDDDDQRQERQKINVEMNKEITTTSSTS